MNAVNTSITVKPILDYLNHQINTDELARKDKVKRVSDIDRVKISGQQLLEEKQLSVVEAAPGVAGSVTITLDKASQKRFNNEVIAATAAGLYQLAGVPVTDQVKAIKDALPSGKAYENNGLKVSQNSVNGNITVKLSGVQIDKNIADAKLADAKKPLAKPVKINTEEDNVRMNTIFNAHLVKHFTDIMVNRRLDSYNATNDRNEFLDKGLITTRFEVLPSDNEKCIFTMDVHVTVSDKASTLLGISNYVLREIGHDTIEAHKGTQMLGRSLTATIDPNIIRQNLREINDGAYIAAIRYAGEQTGALVEKTKVVELPKVEQPIAHLEPAPVAAPEVSAPPIAIVPVIEAVPVAIEEEQPQEAPPAKEAPAEQYPFTTKQCAQHIVAYLDKTAVKAIVEGKLKKTVYNHKIDKKSPNIINFDGFYIAVPHGVAGSYTSHKGATHRSSSGRLMTSAPGSKNDKAKSETTEEMRNEADENAAMAREVIDRQGNNMGFANITSTRPIFQANAIRIEFSGDAATIHKNLITKDLVGLMEATPQSDHGKILDIAAKITSGELSSGDIQAETGEETTNFITKAVNDKLARRGAFNRNYC